MRLVDRVILSLRDQHDRLVEVVTALDEEVLIGPSAASEWRVCDVVSHLGSGAEISLRPIAAAAGGTTPPQADNQAVWDRWNAMTPAEQVAGFVEHDERLVTTLEALGDAERDTVTVDLGFLPAPVPLVVATGLRFNEVTLHAWDVVAGQSPQATIDPEPAALALDLYAGPLQSVLGWAGQPDQLADTAVIAFAGRGLSIGESVVLDDEAPLAPTATLTASDEAAARLLAGRLGPEHTPDDVQVTGNVTLDDLRRVFPGF
ncbi:maleylpyruvate isomerase family mycothiol-dependent enzyme [Nocardioides marinquilinus]|uniref:Maleylpyruvate isomerase family mycothiol-dependent enzyme n=1 Tax=Nocardioides marinquilinus TaxID=1210400 RepID=A0ABP9PSR1_9ACTN